MIGAVVLPLVTYDGLRHWNRRRWLRRFPELRTTELAWIPGSANAASSQSTTVADPDAD